MGSVTRVRNQFLLAFELFAMPPSLWSQRMRYLIGPWLFQPGGPSATRGSLASRSQNAQPAGVLGSWPCLSLHQLTLLQSLVLRFTASKL